MYGHQDKEVEYSNLSKEAQINIEMDKNAKLLSSTIMHNMSMRVPHCNHPLSFSTCFWHNHPMTHQVNQSLYHRITTSRLEAYWMEKGKITQEQLSLLDTKVADKGLKSHKLSMQRFVAKWSCGCLSVGKNMERWNLRHKGNCPYCFQPSEDTNHILMCKHVES